ncbi:hypothetical protein V8F20_004907 [Naviculisporaceae sp. PSN 640]
MAKSKNKTQDTQGYQQASTVKRRSKATRWSMAIIFTAALALSLIVVFTVVTCMDCEADIKVPGHAKWFFTKIVTITSCIVTVFGMSHYFFNHIDQRYTCMIVMPPVNTVIFVLWLVHCIVYAASFAKLDDDHMKRVIWVSLADCIAYLIITVVTWCDWKKYRHEGKNYPALAKYRLPDGSFPMGPTHV